ncbi:signal peptidase I [Hoyosella altamirensis]|uniref:Signal peptidase I n=1 Tax=Hoyosella altamirensis TaxID=616997 RepID=A0A839RQ64_9ACTN|nr:signal peptidase I [Hoyosella altamirensis]MBB3039132.1 signal peptidase [Hoyosella altamirensis]
MTTPATWRSPRRALRKTGAFFSGMLLNILSVLGVVCIIAVICAFAFNITLIMFRTGSMHPTIPAGSLAVVREVPAETVEIGDIITVDREPGLLPVTHRVIGTELGANGATVISMQGDANPNPDPAPYEVTTVRTVLWHMPGLARVIVRVSDPRVMAGITLGAALLVGWAFWPRREDDEEVVAAPAAAEPKSGL